ncbi:octaheme c-type cytochrome, tetrathionate reductase family [Paucidesulfovibrio gracilis DSM 16080]|uniref:Octaheme c-type cytochrome, tetrathionate reductase family n=1 Tax=Paucidesulfovibrio gracilis DSM 16080 TaxID=1121449 RepID=A0A1T4XR24_9BACT|nr:tetrathionate reductase family octaheme c-type cytochrome [Paucidesulfovibrio gracilis]SKA91803.1 octaheme c-type cytochrome, tetrathionate reductase family [Paucidesulfovibrio gracilis DSM 16080]
MRPATRILALTGILLAVAAFGVLAGLPAVNGFAAPDPTPDAAPTEKQRAPRHPAPEGWQAPDQAKAMQRAAEPREFVANVRTEDPKLRQLRFKDLELGVKDIKFPYILLHSPLVNTFEDMYGPVRFMHSKHAASLDGNCALCHHVSPEGADASQDRLSETVACRACHRESFDPDHPERLGLKAAYHQQCMDCHERMNQGPEKCVGCHRNNVPDHKELVELPDNPTALQVTAECLRCHEKAGEDMIQSAHWLWKGPSPYTVDRQKKVMSGKATDTVNNFCVALPSNWPRCTSCHAGYGWEDETFDFTDMTRVDCLVCHDTTDSYVKAPPKAGMPAPEVDLKYVAQRVGQTNRNTCGNCHFQGGGGDAVKHADMCAVLRYPSRNCDVHMGGYDFTCTQCHEAVNHKIKGRSTSLPVAEGSRTCEDCHSDKPHYGDDMLDYHLNKHCDTVACNTCHSPAYSKCTATKTWWDWSLAGDKDRTPVKDKYGMPDYFWKKGEFEWKESKKPVYAWYNGYMERLLLGDAINPDAVGIRPGDPMPDKAAKKQMVVTDITAPVGSIKDPSSKIYPFKVMDGIQPADAKHRYLLVPHLFPVTPDDPTAYWKNRDWQKAFTEGMKAAGLPYSGEYMWVRTNMYWGIHHEVTPKEMALSCVQCHESLKGEQTCDRCHQDHRDVDFKKLAHRGTDFSFMLSQGRDVADLVDSTDYIDFKALGYKGDPILHGGRFTKLPLGRTTP